MLRRRDRPSATNVPVARAKAPLSAGLVALRPSPRASGPAPQDPRRPPPRQQRRRREAQQAAADGLAPAVIPRSCSRHAGGPRKRSACTGSGACCLGGRAKKRPRKHAPSQESSAPEQRAQFRAEDLAGPPTDPCACGVVRHRRWLPGLGRPVAGTTHWPGFPKVTQNVRKRSPGRSFVTQAGCCT